jgi:hypothetical protein
MFSIKSKAAALVTRVTPLRIIIFLASIYLFFTIAYFVLAGLSNGLNMDTYAADGTFQLYNPMRRLLAGEIIGKDFPFFHGVGVPLLHFPFFYLLGHNVFAADATKWLMSPLIFLATTFVFFWAFFRKISHGLIATALLTIVALVCIDVVWPGNSLLGIRTTFPIIVAAFMLWQPRWTVRTKQWSIQLYYPLIALLLALAVACGTEQGLAAIIAYLIIETIRAIRSTTPLKQWWWRITLKALGVIVATYIVLSILTLGHATDALHYALIDIPKDQGWYFGAPPNGYLAWNTLWYIFDKPVLIYMWPIIILGAIAWFIGHKLKAVSTHETYIFSFLIIYGVVVFFASALGYWAPNAQLVPLTRAFGAILVAITVRFILRYMYTVWPEGTKRRIHKYLPSILYAVLFAGLSWYSILAYIQVRPFQVVEVLKTVKLARHAPDGAYASLFWKQRIKEFEPYIPKNATIWSTYTGIYDSMRGQLNGSTEGEDYIIHALGPERRKQYSDDFIKQKPDYAITLRPVYFPYEEWLWDRHWDFYDQLFENYTIIKDNGSHILWKRNDTIRIVDHTKQGSFEHQQNGSYKLIVEPTNSVRLYEVTVSYDIAKLLPVSDKVSRYLLSFDSPSIQHLDISLPSYEHQWTFPVIVKPGQTEISLSPHTHGLIYGKGLSVNNIEYREISLSRNNAYPFYDDLCSYGGPLPYGISCKQDHLGFNYFQSQPTADIFSHR